MRHNNSLLFRSFLVVFRCITGMAFAFSLHYSQPLLAQTPLPTVELIATDDDTGESWPERGAFMLRRSNSNGNLTVRFDMTGTATLGADYQLIGALRMTENATPISPPGGWFAPNTKNGFIIFQDGVQELVIEASPSVDSILEPVETITMNLQPSTAFTIPTGKGQATIQLWDASKPSREGAVRFLCQAGFGPGISTYNGAEVDDITLVQQLGFSGWIDWQMSIPTRKHLPITEAYITWRKLTEPNGFYGTDENSVGWFTAVLGYNSPENRSRPVARGDYDALRQRMAWALSQIFVVGSREFALKREAPQHYYDEVLLKNAFGNYRDILRDLTYHPAMGYYLSHLKNKRKTTDADGNVLTQPDENFAREILQLFSIGVYQLDLFGNVISVNGRRETYTNDNITEFARVFTGLTYGNATTFDTSISNYTQFMKPMDYEILYNRRRDYHDTEAKTLLRDRTAWGSWNLPETTPTTTGNATHTDIERALDNIVSHQNVGPYLGRILIQRFTTSNPSRNYIAAVASKFNNNGAGVRGDFKAVLREILLHPEARNWWPSSQEHYGCLREPMLRLVHYLRTFRVKPPSSGNTAGYLRLPDYIYVIGQEPMRAPSVFNFYRPDFVPPAAEMLLFDSNNDGIPDPLTGPEFQISSDMFLIRTLNNFGLMADRGVGRFGGPTTLDLSTEYQLSEDPDLLVRHLDLRLCAGRLGHRERKIIADGLRTIPTQGAIKTMAEMRVLMALSLINATSEFNISK